MPLVSVYIAVGHLKGTLAPGVILLMCNVSCVEHQAFCGE